MGLCCSSPEVKNSLKSSDTKSAQDRIQQKNKQHPSPVKKQSQEHFPSVPRKKEDNQTSNLFSNSSKAKSPSIKTSNLKSISMLRCSNCKKLDNLENLIKLCPRHFLCKECIKTENFLENENSQCKYCFTSNEYSKQPSLLLKNLDSNTLISSSQKPDFPVDFKENLNQSGQRVSEKFANFQLGLKGNQCISCDIILNIEKFSTQVCELHRFCDSCITSPNKEKVSEKCLDCLKFCQDIQNDSKQKDIKKTFLEESKASSSERNTKKSSGGSNQLLNPGDRNDGISQSSHSSHLNQPFKQIPDTFCSNCKVFLKNNLKSDKNLCEICLKTGKLPTFNTRNFGKLEFQSSLKKQIQPSNSIFSSKNPNFPPFSSIFPALNNSDSNKKNEKPDFEPSIQHLTQIDKNLETPEVSPNDILSFSVKSESFEQKEYFFQVSDSFRDAKENSVGKKNDLFRVNPEEKYLIENNDLFRENTEEKYLKEKKDLIRENPEEKYFKENNDLFRENPEEKYFKENNDLIRENPEEKYSIESKDLIRENQEDKCFRVSKKDSIRNEDFSFSFGNLAVECSLCKSSDSVFGFLCNHNICQVCLTWKCLYDINVFFQNYQVNKEVLLKDFHYFCPVQDCSSKISVPTMMVVENLKRFLKTPQLEVNFKGFQYVLEGIDLWVPFFDGLSSYELF